MHEFTRKALTEALDRAKMFVRQEENYVRQCTEKLEGHQKELEAQRKVVEEISTALKDEPEGGG